MLRKFLLLTVLISFSTNAAFATEKNSQITAWNSAEGLKRLERSKFKNDFYQLANFYQPQENPLFCAVATGTMILNAFNYGNIQSQKTGEITRPTAEKSTIKYPLYSQKDFFNAKTEKVKKRAIIEYKEKGKVGNKISFDAGVSLADFAKILKKGHSLKTKFTYAKKDNKKSIDKFRKTLKSVTSESKSFIIANFNGKIIGQKTGGHISPLVAFDSASDSVLILDVALHKNKWYWVSLESLYKAMHTKDGTKYRGYLVAKR